MKRKDREPKEPRQFELVSIDRALFYYEGELYEFERVE